MNEIDDSSGLQDVSIWWGFPQLMIKFQVFVEKNQKEKPWPREDADLLTFTWLIHTLASSRLDCLGPDISKLRFLFGQMIPEQQFAILKYQMLIKFHVDLFECLVIQSQNFRIK